MLQLGTLVSAQCEGALDDLTEPTFIYRFALNSMNCLSAAHWDSRSFCQVFFKFFDLRRQSLALTLFHFPLMHQIIKFVLLGNR